MTPPGDGERPEAPLPPWARRGPAGSPFTEAQLARFIGSAWDRWYRRKLTPFLEDPRFVPTWNWAAALFMPAWFLYRKLYVAFALFFFLPGVVVRLVTGSDVPTTMQELRKPEHEYFLLMNAGVYLSSVIAAGGLGNWLLFRRAQAAMALLMAQGASAEEEAQLLDRWGGVNRAGTALFVALSVVLTLAQLSA
ncbi:MAG: DUF2628 domain-containing protein [Gemmatimonadetes bacterium]|nr:DUF2628 domain-containing protein [Gemmatimonadota bacterium]